MTIDRVATNAQSQFLLDQINRANVALDKTQQQVSSGNVASDYAGYGSKVSVMEAARSAGARMDAYQSATKLAINQVDLQDTQLSSLSNLADQFRQALTQAASSNDGSDVMAEANSVFQAASQILNAQDANGNYIYGGENTTTPPFTAQSLSDLASMPNVSAAFDNGTIPASVQIGDNQTVQIGVLASNIGSDLMNTLKTVANYVSANGDFPTSMSSAQSTFVSSQIDGAKTASDNLNNVSAANGYVYNRLTDASDQQSSMSTLYQGFVSNIQDVDMPTAISQLNQNQVALQAALQVTSQLQNISLLNYLGSSSTG